MRKPFVQEPQGQVSNLLPLSVEQIIGQSIPGPSQEAEEQAPISRYIGRMHQENLERIREEVFHSMQCPATDNRTTCVDHSGKPSS